MSPLAVRLATLVFQAPEPITRDGARDAARRELSEDVYRRARPDPVQRAIEWVFDKVFEFIDRAARVVPGGIPSLIGLLAVVVVLVVALRLGLGPVGLRDALTDRRRGAQARTAAEYRAEAEAQAGAGRFKEAVRTRLRAIVRELEERGVLDGRAGRTAGEIAREASAAVPAIRGDAHAAATLFDEVWYGDRPAGPAEYDRMRAADERIRDARLVTA